MEPFSLYLHIPFCAQKCPYCDFNSYAVSSIPEQDYVAALLAELYYRAGRSEWQGRTVQTIYFGGGTPSLFSPRSIWKIISAISRTFPIDDQVEITLEANPGTVTPENLEGYREAGVNRLSIGSQSFNAETLKTLGRIHTAEQTLGLFQLARELGIRNISLDLIYGVPGQTLEDLNSDLLQLTELAPEHLSTYGLTIEKGTPFYSDYKKGHLKLLREELIIEMMESLNSALPDRGLGRYEISNFAKSGMEARHNLAYWNGTDYLGLGAGAHGFNRVLGLHPGVSGIRWANYALPNRYITAAKERGLSEAWRDTLSLEEAKFEFFFLGLRKICGVRIKDFEKRFGTRIEENYGPLIEVLTERELLKIHSGWLALTEKGLMLADSVIENFSDTEHDLRPPLKAVPAQPEVETAANVVALSNFPLAANH